MHARNNQIFSNKVNVEYILNAILVKIVDNTPTIIKAMHKVYTIALDLLKKGDLCDGSRLFRKKATTSLFSCP